MANACRGARPVFIDGVTIKFLFNISRLSLEIADRRRGAGTTRHQTDVTEWIDARHASANAGSAKPVWVFQIFSEVEYFVAWSLDFF